MARADAAQVRALVAAYRRPDDHRRALALHADAEWSGPDVLDAGGTAVRVVPCASPLTVRAALVDHRADEGELLVLLTQCSGSELGLDVRARLVKGDVLPLDPFGSILALFHATVLDPQLVSERWLIDDLVTLAPSGGWARQPLVGVLDADLAWQTWHEARLAVIHEPADLDGILALGQQLPVANAIAQLRPEPRNRLAARWTQRVGPAVPVMVDVVAAGGGPDLVALGLVAQVLWATTDRPELAGDQTIARVRLESTFGRDRLDHRGAAAWGAAAERALVIHPSPAAVLDAAEEILRASGASQLAVLSDMLPQGFDERLGHLAAALTAGNLDDAETTLANVVRHRHADRRRHRVAMAAAAVRLLRRRSQPCPIAATTFAAAVLDYATDGAFLDEARQRLDEGDHLAQLTAAYSALTAEAQGERSTATERFVELLADWSRSEPVADERIVPLESLLDAVVVPIAADAPVLLVVGDGLAFPVAHELLRDLVTEGWAPAVPADRDSWPVGVALLPTVTDVSRTSLLAGSRVVGGQAEEKAGFAAHQGLRAASRPSRPPVLLHKAELVGPSGTALPDEVRQVVADPDQRLVGVVVNSVDDHLARGDQVRVGWDLAALRPLGWLLDAAAEAGRVVVLTADHGHVLQGPHSNVRQLPGGGERWRVAPPVASDGEVEITGPRVLRGGGTVILPADDRLHYGGHKHGYHGGATPEEVLVPVEVLARRLPDGWRHRPLATPSWWEPADLAVELPVAPSRTKPPKTAPKAQASLFEANVKPATEQAPSAGSSWTNALLASPAFIVHRERTRLPRPLADDRLRRYLDAIAANGGSMPLATLSSRTGEPQDTLRMALTQVQRLVNLDGSEILAVRADGTVELNQQLAALQFELDAS